LYVIAHLAERSHRSDPKSKPLVYRNFRLPALWFALFFACGIPTARGDEAPPAGTLPVPGGTFTMGTDREGELDERPAHEVTVGSFHLDTTEVTNAAYDRCVAASKCEPKDKKIGKWPLPRHPVTGVRWDDARAYCEWRGMRLPTEAEFERAVRGTDGRRFAWGNNKPTEELTVALGRSGPLEVGSRPKGNGPFGHSDLAGNVWEWVNDLYDPYAYRRDNAKTGQPGTCEAIMSALAEIKRSGKRGFTGTNAIKECERSIRGGAYNYPANGLRATNRVHHPGRWRLRMTGFRCAKTAGE
jgi:formylglycine-generating enzyme required for sulfatase activity